MINIIAKDPFYGSAVKITDEEGNEISMNGLMRVDISMEAARQTTATLTYRVKSIDIENAKEAILESSNN